LVNEPPIVTEADVGVAYVSVGFGNAFTVKVGLDPVFQYRRYV
jgi:hypothetical protein